MRRSKKIVLRIFALLVIVILAATIIIPKKLDKKFNTVTLKPEYTISKEALQLYNSLDFISDMHY